MLACAGAPHRFRLTLANKVNGVENFPHDPEDPEEEASEESNGDPLAALAAFAALRVAQAPGRLEKRMVLMQAFAQAHQVNPAITSDPDLTVVDRLLQHPEALIPDLLATWARMAAS